MDIFGKMGATDSQGGDAQDFRSPAGCLESQETPIKTTKGCFILVFLHFGQA